ncbi:hypothetical protein [Adhaeribacter aquaticus]|uniref:hypothetical protein n=1 Tax=Adhaeribacter aquaticus TaxID=299567 RepID=UPI0004073B30|nr:hypothetical protein [Adhaeribacter aquaticus]
MKKLGALLIIFNSISFYACQPRNADGVNISMPSEDVLEGSTATDMAETASMVPDSLALIAPDSTKK